jgi:hypothetical protein
VLLQGLRAGIERASKIVMPALFLILVILVVRALTLPGAGDGVRWFIIKFHWADLTPSVMVAAIGHMVFSLSLGGTFMVVYGSYLGERENVARPAIWTVIGDTGTSLLAGLAIIPAVFAFHLPPAQGPGLLFSTLPQVFAAMPMGWLFGLLFFAGLFGAGYLSDIAAFEVLVAGLTDNTRLSRTPRGVVDVRGGVPGHDPAHHQQRDLRPLGSHVRLRHADAGRAARGAHRGLVHAALHGAGRALRPRLAARAGVALLLDPVRDPGGHPDGGDLVAAHQRSRRRSGGIVRKCPSPSPPRPRSIAASRRRGCGSCPRCRRPGSST